MRIILLVALFGLGCASSEHYGNSEAQRAHEKIDEAQEEHNKKHPKGFILDLDF